MPAPIRLFFYGTLQRGAAGPPGTDNPMLAELTAVSTRLGRGRVRGRLHRIRWYPGLVDSRDRTSTVAGEVVELTDPGFLATLDAYENASNPPAPGDEYVRRRKRVTLDDGRTVTAWTYCYNRDPGDAPVIVGGDFLKA